MTNFEKEILDYVREHPGCNTTDLILAIDRPNTGDEINYMIECQKLDRWYSGQVPAYYIPGTYTPPHLRDYTPPNRRESEASGAELRELIPLAAGLHKDKSIHIYVNEEDSGLSVGILEDGTLHVKIEETMRTMVAGKA